MDSELKPPLSADVLGGTLIVNFPTVLGWRIGSEVGNRWGTRVVGADDVDAASVSGCWMDDGIRKWIESAFGLGQGGSSTVCALSRAPPSCSVASALP
jgi:hypothetical protein